MALLSPGSEIKEINVSVVTNRVGDSAAVFVGDFTQGPVDELTPIGTTNDYVTVFGEPNSNIMNQWYQGYNFLNYGAGFSYITRVVGASALNSVAEVGSASNDAGLVAVPQLVKNASDWDVFSLGEVIFGEAVAGITVDLADLGVTFETSGPGTTLSIVVNSLDVTLIDGTKYSFDDKEFIKIGNTTIVADLDDGINPVVPGIFYLITEDIMVPASLGSKLKFFARNPGTWGDTLEVSIANASDFGTETPSEAFSGVAIDDQFEYAAAVGEVAVLITKDNIVVETYIVSLDESAVDYANKSTYIENVINKNSALVYVKDNVAVADIASKMFSQDGTITNDTVKFAGGNNGTATQSEIIEGYKLYENIDEIDVDLVIANELSQVSAINLANYRKDCIAYVGATFGTTVGKTAIVATQAIVDYTKVGDMNVNTVYAAFYGNYKFQFDKFTGKNVWLNLAGDMAGIRAQTNELQNPWTAAAGIQRGGVKNVKKFAFIPNKTQRDLMYQNKTNIVTSFPGSGNVIWGNKTYTSVPSAFDRVTTRALFNYLERVIYKTSKSFTFEINDSFTRNRFLSAIVPFLNTVQSNRGINEYRAICDNTNNTPAIVERNEFIADIIVKPNYITEFITLRFTAVNASTDIDTIIG